MNDRGPKPLLLVSLGTFSALSHPAPAESQSTVATPASRPNERLRLAIPRDGREDDTSADVSEAPKCEEMFVANLGTIERVIRFVCQRHKLTVVEADEFASEVKFRLIEHDYAVFRHFQHRSSLGTYLTVVIQRIYLDYLNQQRGKWRPSAEARRLGPVAIRLETLMARDGLSFDQACEHLRTNEGLTVTEPDLNDIAVKLPARAGRVRVGEDAMDANAARAHSFDDGIGARERRAAGRRIVCALTAAAEALGDQDRLILRLRFQDGLAVADIARALHLHQKSLYPRFEALLRQLRSALEAAGIDRTEALEIVNRKDVDISLALLGGTPGAAVSAPDPGPREPLAR